jgi:phospholipid/cholesterol/gamma-HCH transport system ATP-binding protein
MANTETHSITQEKQNRKEQGDTTLAFAENFSKSFDDTQVLHDISFELHKKEHMVVLGKSGTGKSVLIKSMVGLHRPSGGKLEVLGKDLREIENKELIELRRKVGYLFQGGALYDSMTVRDNLRFPLERQLNPKPEDEIQHLVEEGLESVGLSGAIDKMPSELSGGMKKRIALARTLILRPKIMLYDEPTTGLDPVTSKDISQLILEMRDRYDITSVIVTHDIASAEIISDKIYIIKDGQFGAEGTFKELSNSDEDWIRAFFE